MADADNTKLTTEQIEYFFLTDQLQSIAVQLAGMAPILKMICDSGTQDYGVACSLELVGGMAERLRLEICDVAEKLNDSFISQNLTV